MGFLPSPVLTSGDMLGTLEVKVSVGGPEDSFLTSLPHLIKRQQHQKILKYSA